MAFLNFTTIKERECNFAEETKMTTSSVFRITSQENFQKKTYLPLIFDIVFYFFRASNHNISSTSRIRDKHITLHCLNNKGVVERQKQNDVKLNHPVLFYKFYLN